MFTSAVARDDSPDLDTDLKILNRVCCRDMKEVIIFDDRVDVWNETPGNVIRAQPYNFLSNKKYSVVKALEELVVGSTSPLAENVAVAIDYDCHLFHVKEVLLKMFHEYVNHEGKVPSFTVLSNIRKQVLTNINVQFTGFNDLQTLTKDIEDFGGSCQVIRDEVDDTITTNVLVAAKHTKRVYDTKKEDPRTRVVHWSWLEHVKATWQIANLSMFDHSRFRMDEAGVYGPMDNWEVAWIAATAMEDASEKGTLNSSREKRRKRD
jgi:hypothetical protein